MGLNDVLELTALQDVDGVAHNAHVVAYLVDDHIQRKRTELRMRQIIWPVVQREDYPAQPAPPLTRWFVRMIVQAAGLADTWKHECHLWAYSSSDAVLRARADFYGNWATPADRERLPLRVLEVLQEGV